MAGETGVAETPEIQSSPAAPTCPGCGFTVSEKGELCPACKDKADASPQGRWQLGAQPVPVQMRDGHAPRSDDDDDDYEEEE